MSLVCISWEPVFKPHERPNSWTIIHEFSSFRAIFRLPGARQLFFVLELPRAPRVLLDAPMCLEPSFPIFPSLCLLGTTLVKLRRDFRWHRMAFQGMSVPSKGLPRPWGAPYRNWYLAPGFMDYNPCFFPVFGPFFDIPGPTTFFVPKLPVPPRRLSVTTTFISLGTSANHILKARQSLRDSPKPSA